ncbi:hypothetical protein M1349_01115 [Patescibacteria group bacterium]|nr:hypothetical protein [Patescibacteria group bacterium]
MFNKLSQTLPTVNSIKKRSIPTINSITDGIYIDGSDYKNDAFAQELAEKLDDLRSISYYRILAKETDHQKLRDILSYVLETEQMGKIKKSKISLFMFLLEVRGIKRKFKKTKDEKC